MTEHTQTRDTGLPPDRHEDQSAYLLAFILVTVLFFAWGFVTVFVDMLIPRLKSLFELTYARVMLVQFGFFLAYLLVSLPAAILVSRIGYRNGIVVGLLVMACGAGLFYPASIVRVFELFVFALFVLASGITILQVAANPLVTFLGPSRTAPSRLNLSQAFNSLGTTLAPMVGAALLLNIDVLSPEETAALSPEALIAYQDASANSVQLPFGWIATFLIFVAIIFAVVRFHIADAERDDAAVNSAHAGYASALSSRPLVFGIVAIFVYVGAEVSIGSFLVNYLIQDETAGLTAKSAAGLVTFYWGGAMVGRFVGAIVMRYARVRLVLSMASALAMVLVLVTIILGGPISVWTILAVGFFNSIHFPTIFALAIDRLGPHVARGSGYLCMAIFGGAIIPLFMGLAADAFSIRYAFFIPAACYAYLFWYARYGSTHRSALNE